MHLTLILIIIILIPIYFLFKILSKHYRLRKLINKIPGPEEGSWLFGNVLQFKFRRTDFTYQIINLLWNYGCDGIYRLWIGPIPLVILTRAHTIEPLLSSNKLIEKSSNYDFLKNWIGTGLLISGGEKWRYRRKMLTPTFHFSILTTFVEIFCRQAKILVDQLQPFAEKKLPFNICPYIGRCALDIICETAMGVHTNAQQNHKSDYVQAVAQMCEILFKYERMPWLWWKPIFNVIYGKQYKICMTVLRSFVEKVICERIEERNKAEKHALPQIRKRLAFLDLLLNMQNEHKLTYEDIREEVDTFMFEGHDTTSASMSWTLYLLGQYPDVQNQCVEELQSIFNSDEREPTEEDLKEMKYLECVIKESLRIYTPVPLFARKLTDDFETNGYKIPSGVDVMVIPYFVHRDIKIWGNNPEEFRPERFSSEASINRHPYDYVPFSAGSRNCIGQKFALLEEKVVLSTILRKFIISSLDPQISDKMAIPDIILRPVNGIKVFLKPRSA